MYYYNIQKTIGNQIQCFNDEFKYHLTISFV